MLCIDLMQIFVIIINDIFIQVERLYILISEVKLWTTVVVEVRAGFSYIVIISIAAVMSIICSGWLCPYVKTIA